MSRIAFIIFTIPAIALWADLGSAQMKPQKEVKFQVISLRPMKPGAGLSLAESPTPNGYRATLSLWQMIMLAYTTGDHTSWGATEVKNAPAWIGDFYDIDARVAQADLQAWQNQSSQHELLRSAMRAALADRCRLALHEEPSQAAMFELVVVKGGPHLRAAAPGSPLPQGGVKLPSGGAGIGTGRNGTVVWHYYSATMGDLVQFLKVMSNGRSVYDKTGLSGRYDFSFRQISEPVRGDDAIYNFPVDSLGLKLRQGKESRPNLVIDHIEKPRAN